MHSTERQPERAPDGAPLDCERHRPEQSTLYQPVQQHATSLIAHTEASTGSGAAAIHQGRVDALLQCAILAHGFLRLLCGDCST